MFCFLAPSAPKISGPSNDDDNKANVTTTAKKTLVWAHETCYHPELPPSPPCRHWKRLGRCPALNAGMCAFQHDEDEKGASATLDKQRWGGKRHFVRNQHKNSVFRIFLMQTYGTEYLTKEDGVIIDAAGGKGELSWELLNLTGVNQCLVIDPRPLSLSLVQTKWKKGLFEPKRTGPVFSKWYPSCEDGCRLRESKSPDHLRCFFDSDLYLEFMNVITAVNHGGCKLKEVERSNHWFECELDRAKRIAWTTKGLQHEDGTSYNEELTMYQRRNQQKSDSTYDETEQSAEVTDPSIARDILQRCNLIVGFHPDQAAGDIADFAITRGIPWCIVPCCVYSDSFSRRKLKDGTSVKTHEQLVQWLCEKDANAKVATLDVEGKNIVVYTLPMDKLASRCS